MNVLELFAGSCSLGNEARKMGMNVFSVDWHPYENINLVKDINQLTEYDIPFIPDLIWLSPDCTTYTIAAISHHRDGVLPKSDYAKKCDEVNQNAIKLVKHFLNINPKMVFYFENPRGMLRKMPFMQQFERTTIWYCQYGDDRAKPTDIFTNNLKNVFNSRGWEPKSICWNGNKKCHHQAAPRGSKTGTQGLPGSFERSKIPKQLCIDILENLKQINQITL